MLVLGFLVWLNLKGNNPWLPTLEIYTHITNKGLARLQRLLDDINFEN